VAQAASYVEDSRKEMKEPRMTQATHHPKLLICWDGQVYTTSPVRSSIEKRESHRTRMPRETNAVQVC
jgi:hypothetical protein